MTTFEGKRGRLESGPIEKTVHKNTRDNDSGVKPAWQGKAMSNGRVNPGKSCRRGRLITVDLLTLTSLDLLLI
jgi:hypothetical protein